MGFAPLRAFGAAFWGIAFCKRFPIKCAPSRKAMREDFVDAGVAQLVEQRIRNAKVGGSIPLTGTITRFQKLALAT